MNGIIYCAKAPDGQMYVGQTTDPLHVRKWGHKTQAKKIKKLPPRDKQGMPEAITKFGIENFVWVILEDGIKSATKLSKRETFYIKDLDTLWPNGLNLTEKLQWGETGKNNPNAKSVEIDGIKFDTITDAAKHFGKSHQTIVNWSKGGRRGSGAPPGKDHPMFGKTGEKSPNYGTKRTDEEKIKMRESHPRKRLADNPNAKPVEIDGIKFKCRIDAAKYFGVGKDTILAWSNGGHRGRRVGKNNQNARPVEIDGIKFGCVNGAVKHFGVHRCTIQEWVNGRSGSKNHEAKYL